MNCFHQAQDTISWRMKHCFPLKYFVNFYTGGDYFEIFKTPPSNQNGNFVYLYMVLLPDT